MVTDFEFEDDIEARWLWARLTPMRTDLLEDDLGLDHRLVRLFAVACYDHGLGDKPSDPLFAAAVRVAERYADGDATAEELAAARQSVEQVKPESYRERLAVARAVIATAEDGRLTHEVAEGVWEAGQEVDTDTAYDWREDLEMSLEYGELGPGVCPLETYVRDLARQGHMLVALAGHRWNWDPAWATKKVTGLARRMYESRKFHRMGALADALWQAGCNDEGLLAYCQGGGPFFRGSWVLDMATGRRQVPEAV